MQILIFILLLILIGGKILNFLGNVNQKVNESKTENSQPKVKMPLDGLNFDEEINEFKKMKEDYKDELLEYLANDKYSKMAEIIPLIEEIEVEIQRLTVLKRKADRKKKINNAGNKIVSFFKGLIHSA